MKRKLKGLILLSGTVLMLLSACEYEFTQYPAPPPPPLAGDTISFSQDIQPIFTAKCISCHPTVYKPDLGSGKSYNALTNGSYVVAGEPATSPLYAKLKSGGSMANYVSAAQLDLIYRWIYAGAKND